MEVTGIVLVMLFAVVTSRAIARFTHLPAPFVQIGLGVAIYYSGLTTVSLDPEVFFLLLLPPLLFLDGWRIPKDELRRDAGSILKLAFGLVFFTVLGVGFLIHWLIPTLPLPVAFALAAFTVAFGVAAFSKSFGPVTRWSAFIMAIAVGVSLLSPWPMETGILASGPFYAALSVLVMRIALGALRRIRNVFAFSSKELSTGMPVLILFFTMSISGPVQSQEKALVREVHSLDDLVAALKAHAANVDAPIEIPVDAILVPYEPDQPSLNDTAQKILVPYSTYTQLLSLTNPTAPTTKSADPPVDYSLSGLVAATMLDGDDFLSLSLSLEITPHTERSILVPFVLEGAVLTSAQLDGEPASISSGSNGLALLVQGAREHRFTANFQIPIQRQGGWRIVNAKLPSAPSGRLQLNLPEANTEVRMVGLPDAELRETTNTNETIQTSHAKKPLKCIFSFGISTTAK